MAKIPISTVSIGVGSIWAETDTGGLFRQILSNPALPDAFESVDASDISFSDSFVFPGQYAPVASAAKTSAAGALAIDFATDGNVVEVSLTEDVTEVTLSNPVAKGRYLLILEQDGTGGWAVSGWPTIRWVAGSAPTITVTADKADQIALVRTEAGEWLGAYVQNF